MDWIGMGIGFGITFAIVSMGVAWRARRRGHLLLDAGVVQGPVLSRNPAAYLPLVIFLVGVWVWSTRVGPYPLVMAPMALAGVLAVAVVVKKRIHLRFTDQGICYFALIKWGQIGSYRWDKNSQGSVELELHISSKGRHSIVSYPIPAMHRKRVAEVLTAHVPRGS